MPTRVVLLVASSVALLLLGFAPAPFPKNDRKRTDQTDVVGTWAFTIWEYNGQRYEFQEKAYKAKVTREGFDLIHGGGGPFMMLLDPTASPPAFTWTIGDQLTHAGCYRLEGDTMTMVFVDGSRRAARPTDLTRCPPNGWRFVMRRVGRD